MPMLAPRVRRTRHIIIYRYCRRYRRNRRYHRRRPLIWWIRRLTITRIITCIRCSSNTCRCMWRRRSGVIIIVWTWWRTSWGIRIIIIRTTPTIRIRWGCSSSSIYISPTNRYRHRRRFSFKMRRRYRAATGRRIWRRSVSVKRGIILRARHPCIRLLICSHRQGKLGRKGR